MRVYFRYDDTRMNRFIYSLQNYLVKFDCTEIKRKQENLKLLYLEVFRNSLKGSCGCGDNCRSQQSDDADSPAVPFVSWQSRLQKAGSE